MAEPISRARLDAQIYTNDASSLTRSLSNDVSKATAIEFAHSTPSLSIGQNTSTVGIALSMD